MGKPSIFSKNYNKQVKRRRRVRFVSIGVIAVCIGTGVLYLSDNMFIFEVAKEKVISVLKLNKDSNKEIDDIEAQEEVQKVDNTEEETLAKEEKPESKVQRSQGVDLGSNITANIILSEESSKTTIIDVEKNPTLEFNISDKKDAVVLLNKETQDMFLWTLDGKLEDITKKEFIDTENNKYPKGKQLSLNPNLIWAAKPTFISENKILYLSKLPWFDTNHKLFVWTYDISKKTHALALDKRLQGDNIKVVESNGEKVKLDIDGQVISITLDGRVIP